MLAPMNTATHLLIALALPALVLAGMIAWPTLAPPPLWAYSKTGSTQFCWVSGTVASPVEAGQAVSGSPCAPSRKGQPWCCPRPVETVISS